MSPVVSWSAGAFVGSAAAHMLSQRLGRGVLELGLALMLAGGVTAWGMVGPNLVGGIGMGMIFQAVQQLGMSLGVAIAGTVLGSGRGRAADFLHAREVTCAASAALGRARAGGGVPEPAAARSPAR